MMRRGVRLLSLLCGLALVMGGLPGAARAQDGGERYENAELGIAFDLPAGWDVAVGTDGVVAGMPDDRVAVQTGTAPQGLAIRVIVGTFSGLGISDATQLPDLLARLVTNVPVPPAPEPVQLSSGTGYQILFTLPDEGLTTRVVLLAVAGGRVAVVRGIASSAAWDGSAGATFDAVLQSLVFSAPAGDQAALEQVTADDGGVIWQYQAPSSQDGRTVRAGGITYDAFGVLYMAAGPAGVMALDQTSGAAISTMGPWGDAADYVDVAIGPDTLLYLANAAPETNQAVVVVDRAGNYARGWGLRGDGDGQFAPGMPRTIAVTKGGDVWVASEGHAAGARNRLYKFDAYGNLMVSVDLDTVDPALSGVRLDNNVVIGALYIVGANGGLTALDTNGQPLARNLAADVLQGVTVTDIAIAPDDNIILSLAAPGWQGSGLLELSPSGRLVDRFGAPYDTARGGPFQPGEYLNPTGLVVTADGTPHWSETGDASGFTQVQAFTFVGDATLSVAAAPDAGEGTASEAAAQGGGPITPGQTVRGTLNNNTPAQEWTFEGQADAHVIITMIDAGGQGALDPLVNLRDVNGRVIASNDDVGSAAPEGMTSHDARLEFDLPGSGSYTIEATRFGGRGSYVLTFEIAP